MYLRLRFSNSLIPRKSITSFHTTISMHLSPYRHFLTQLPQDARALCHVEMVLFQPFYLASEWGGMGKWCLKFHVNHVYPPRSEWLKQSLNEVCTPNNTLSIPLTYPMKQFQHIPACFQAENARFLPASNLWILVANVSSSHPSGQLDHQIQLIRPFCQAFLKARKPSKKSHVLERTS